jgi:hypothetical protein
MRIQKCKNLTNFRGTFIKKIKTNIVKELDASRKKINDEEATHIFKFMEKNTAIIKLNLMDNLISDKSINNILEFLRKNKTIETLELEGNDITVDGIDKFIVGLKDNWSLTDLFISEEAFNDQLDVILKLIILRILMTY